MIVDAGMNVMAAHGLRGFDTEIAPEAAPPLPWVPGVAAVSIALSASTGNVSSASREVPLKLKL